MIRRAHSDSLAVPMLQGLQVGMARYGCFPEAKTLPVDFSIAGFNLTIPES